MSLKNVQFKKKKKKDTAILESLGYFCIIMSLQKSFKKNSVPQKFLSNCSTPNNALLTPRGHYRPLWRPLVHKLSLMHICLPFVRHISGFVVWFLVFVNTLFILVPLTPGTHLFAFTHSVHLRNSFYIKTLVTVNYVF